MDSIPYTIKNIINTNNTIVIGFDVSHNKRRKSAAAMVSLGGKFLDNHFSNLKLYNNYEEISGKIVSMFQEHVEYYLNHGLSVDQIILYRDGVSEG